MIIIRHLMDSDKLTQLITENNNKNNTISLVCRDKETGWIKSVDVGKCHRSLTSFGRYVPDFKCGDDNNIHTCSSQRCRASL